MNKEIRNSAMILIASVSLIFPLLLFSTPAQSSEIQGFDVIAENQFLTLFINEETTEIAVREKATDTMWYSNPRFDEGEREQIGIRFYNPLDAASRRDSFTSSVEYNQYTVLPIEDGVRIEYVFGEMWDERDFLPRMIALERFETMILAEVENERDRDFLRSNYQVIALTKAEDDYERVKISHLSSEQKEAIFGDYTLISPGRELQESEKVALFDLLIDRFLRHNREIREYSDIQPQHFAQLMDTPTLILKDGLLSWDEEDMAELIRDTTYTPEDVQFDHLANHIDPPRPADDVFFIPVEYYLEDQDFIARVPTQDIQYPHKVRSHEFWQARGLDSYLVGRGSGYEQLVEVFERENGTQVVSWHLYQVRLLRYFGLKEEQTPDDYLFIPDGTGALIYMDRNSSDLINLPIYGRDQSIEIREERGLLTQKTHLPVFGLKQGDHAFIAMIEDGTAMGGVEASTTESPRASNTVYSVFTPIPMGQTQMPVGPRGGRGNVINLYQDRLTSGDMQVRYSFLHGEEASYSGMARYYQNYLVEKYGLEKIKPDNNIPFFLELVGAVSTQRPWMGFPRRVMLPLTTFEQAQTIVEKLQENGVENINLRYTGWQKGGIRNYFLDTVDIDRSLGREQDLLDLKDFLTTRGVGFFLDVGFTNVHRTSLVDGFIPYFHAARNLENIMVRAYDYNLATQQNMRHTERYILSPSRLDTVVDTFVADFKRLDLGGLSLRDLGRDVNSDFRDGRLIDRVQALEIILGQLKKISDQGINTMFDGGNSYVLPFADSILNLPVNYSYRDITDKSVPFYQMVVKGYIPFAGEPINLSQDFSANLLRTIETGASPYYKWIYSDNSIIKGTEADYLYTTHYLNWLEHSLNFYREANELLAALQDKRIVKHESLKPDVYQTTYENGVSIIVNYGITDVEIDGIQVPAEGFKEVEK